MLGQHVYQGARQWEPVLHVKAILTALAKGRGGCQRTRLDIVLCSVSRGVTAVNYEVLS